MKNKVKTSIFVIPNFFWNLLKKKILLFSKYNEIKYSELNFLSIKKENRVSTKAFTLVELIVTIVILIILASIGFLGLTKYTSMARDTQRVQDLKSIEEVINYYEANNYKFPLPNNITGRKIDEKGVEWIVGTFGTGNTEKVKQLNKLLKDPTTGNFFEYSVSKNGKAYMLKAKLEKGEDFILQNPVRLAKVGEDEVPYTNIPENLPIETPKCETYLTQAEADELNNLTNKTHSRSQWCNETYLSLHNLTKIPNGVKKIRFLGGGLSLGIPKLKNLDYFKGVKNFFNLYLNNNNIENLEGLKGNDKIRGLFLNSNDIKNIEVLKYVPNLGQIDLGNNKNFNKSSLKIIYNLSNIDCIYLSNINLNNLNTNEFIKLNGKLDSLDLTYNNLGELAKRYNSFNNFGKYCDKVGINGENICIENKKGEKIKITIE